MKKIEVIDIREVLDDYARVVEEEETMSYSDIVWLESHKQDVLDYGNASLCAWAGITEEEYNNNKLNEEK